MNEATIRANQRLLNEAWTHLSKTKKKAMNSEGFCTYVGSGCAFSPAVDIPKAQEKKLLGKGAATLIVGYPEVLHPWARDIQPSFAQKVQNECHDRIKESSNPDYFVNEVKASISTICSMENYDYPWENE